MDSDKLERRRIVYTGKVQGVGFRATARSVARGRPVSGWVRNQSDGSVLLEVQGVPEEVDSYLNAVRERMGRLISQETAQAIGRKSSEAGFEVRH
jgi:acylphosphatase